MTEVEIRPYEARDRQAVRRISCDTADRGEPVEIFFSDREAVADLLTRYYTDYEPNASWVAAHEARVIGYLTGCLDAHRYFRAMATRIIPETVIRTILRGALLRQETWKLVLAGIRTWRRGGFPRHIPLQRYPAHLHINLQHGFRRHRVGQRLVERFVEQVRGAGLRGIHSAVREDNAAACRFFEKLGFVVLSHHLIILPCGGAFRAHYTAIYGKAL